MNKEESGFPETRDSLFTLLDAIGEQLKRAESLLRPGVPRYVYGRFQTATIKGRLRICYKSPEWENPVPVSDCKIDVRIAFAKISADFLAGYAKHATQVTEELTRQAVDALQQITRAVDAFERNSVRVPEERDA